MPSKTALASLSALGAGTAATGGVLGHRYFSKDSLLSKLQRQLKDSSHRKILTSKDDPIWNSWKEFYGAETKAPISGINKENLSQWCEDSLAGKDESKLTLVSKWCVVNTRSVKEELQANSITFLEEESSGWEGAWETYNKDKASLEIEDAAFKGTNATQKQQGGSALKKWCETYLSKKMYEFFEGGKSYEKVAKWCSKSAG
ncbi:hypothetical protein HF1_08770 [Mycoplasma haemofelis str. Langford 1]|uniref:Uncharacterized protein n=1 Tax=Mycoplasma haemofelis (strain Langford 1) TaxID=941640 RepID=E8ZIB4_MYCHL|nr:hypothetical protein [Mycoplasma haemofelis]CBY92885.1 hypothetical protein HF1_08770 [Mycoplasma haemofelis str. Langford 1]